ncbi:hypothetical protein [Luteimonas saliphila]|uniref:hypothetical protein n=1 Tax=Luteimonas saliphila TaxID=2804919 RepID=UPI00192E2847|nr:hypothetical protein [Luteimonas saliphila]
MIAGAPTIESLLEDALALRDGPGRLHLTLSFLVEEARMQALVTDREGRCYWNRALLATLRGDDDPDADDYQDSRRLGHAIEPLFNDIADRQRGLFIQDFLLDTPSDPRRGDDADGENVCDEVELAFPADVRWETEGDRFALALSAPVRLAARCRAFWVAHSNTALTYHLSLELPYAHDHAHYYALSLLQKAVFPSEGTRWLDGGDDGLRVRSRLAGAALPLQAYVAAMFERHAASLLAGVRVALARRGLEMAPPSREGGLWRRLLLSVDGPDHAPPRALGELRCRTVFLLQDPYFFALLRPQLRTGLRELTAIRPARGGDGRNRYDEADLQPGRCPPAHLDYYFVSGFLQNILDFLRQDVSEIQDGTDPIYPPAGIDDQDSHFLVYATQSSVYEVVAGSRSLEVGRGWIGTCPYLFLVHLMTMHNESLVRTYEAMVRGLIEKLERDGLLHADAIDDTRAYSTHVADEAFEAFRRFRLDTFNHVARHRYFNVLRYDTEREFYESIETVRGINQREEYWAKVVGELEQTVDDLRDNEAQKSEKFLERVLFYVAFLGMLQVVFQLIDFGFDGAWAKLRYALAASVATVAVMLALFHSRGLINSRRWRQALRFRRSRRPDDLSRR